jgi:uncharacterized BrkB/YihY/UPF0761 family membrane protein
VESDEEAKDGRQLWSSFELEVDVGRQATCFMLDRILAQMNANSPMKPVETPFGDASGGDPGVGPIVAAEPRAARSPGLGASRARDGLARSIGSRIVVGRRRLGVKIEAHRRRSTLVDTLFEVQDHDSYVGGGILAGAVAFRLFLFLVPLVYVAVTVLGVSARVASQNPAHMAKSVGISGVLARAIVNSHNLKASTEFVLFAGAVWALLHTARSLTKTLFAVHARVWGLAQAKPKGIKPTLALIGVVLALAVAVLGLNRLRNALWGVGVVLAIIILTASTFAIWWWVSTHFPHAAVPAWALIPGALLMAVGVELLHVFTTYWIAHQLTKRSETYGAVGIALTVLLWTYLLGRLIVASAGLNITLWRRYRERITMPLENDDAAVQMDRGNG